MTTLLETLFEVTIYSAMVYGAILLFKKLFHKHISAAMNYAIWMLLIIRLLIPVTIDSGFSLIAVSVPAPVVQGVDISKITPSAQIFGAADGEQIQSQPASFVEEASDNANAVEVSAPTQASILKINWQTALVLLWSAGFVFCCGFSVASAIRLNRKIKYGRIEVPAYVLDIVEECKRNYKIKRDIKVTMHEWLNSPSLSASLRPRLLLSGNLPAMSRQQITFAIRHELTHYKRKDHLMILVLIILRCVYWFNPVVWLSFPQLQTDMETFCDASVTSGLQKAERNSYINIMVALSGNTNTRHVLGMGQGRKMLEKRIRGIFMKQKTKTAVRLAALMLTFVMLFTCFTTACQPTPADAIVIGKDMQQMLGKAKAPHESGVSLKERLAIPDRFTGSTQDETGRFKAVMDATFTIPNVNDIPIVRVEAQPFDHGTVEKIKDYFFDDGPCYDPEALYEETKPELVEILAKLKARKAELEGKGMKPLHPELESGDEADETSSPQNDESDETVQMSAYNMLDMVNESIQFIQKKLPDALEQKNKIEVPNDWQAFGGASEYMYFSQMNPNGGMCTLSAGRDQNDVLYIANRKDFDPNRGFYDTEESWYANNNPEMFAAEIADAQSLKFPSITMDEAQQTADDFLKQVGIEGFVCERIEKVIGGSGQTYGDDVLRGNLLKGYRLQYVRLVSGVPLTYTDDDSASSFDNENFFYWNYERITFIIDDNGIAELQWKAPYNVLDTVVDSASMLPFSDIADIINDKITIVNDWLDIEGFDITITEARLGFMRVIEQNSTKQGLLIPVWDFFGTYKEYIDRDGEKYTTEIKCPTRSYLTINAIDGAVIDRQKGY